MWHLGRGGRAQGTRPRNGSQTSRPGIPGLSSVSQEGQEKMLHGPLEADRSPSWEGVGRGRAASDLTLILTFESFTRRASACPTEGASKSSRQGFRRGARNREAH